MNKNGYIDYLQMVSGVDKKRIRRRVDWDPLARVKDLEAGVVVLREKSEKALDVFKERYVINLFLCYV